MLIINKNPLLTTSMTILYGAELFTINDSITQSLNEEQTLLYKSERKRLLTIINIFHKFLYKLCHDFNIVVIIE